MSRECGLRLQKPTYWTVCMLRSEDQLEQKGEPALHDQKKTKKLSNFTLHFTDFRVPHSSRPSLDFESRLLLRAPVGTTGSIECYSRDISLIVRTYIQRLHSDVLLSESRHHVKIQKGKKKMVNVSMQKERAIRLSTRAELTGSR